MKNQTVKYKGINYSVRSIEVRDKMDLGKGKAEVLKRTVCIASVSLNKAYDEKQMSVHGSVEQKLDASIDHYVSDNAIKSMPDVVTGSQIEELMMEVLMAQEELVEAW